MDIRSLRYFVTVTDFHNMSRAAEHLHISQPALSQAMKGLEQEIGQPIFRRVMGGVELTDVGKRLRYHALRILHAVDDAEEELGTRTRFDTELNIGVLPTLAEDYVPGILRAFQETTADAPMVGLREAHTEGLVKEVLSGALHLAVLDLPVSEPQLAVEKLWQERLVIVSPPSSDLKGRVPWTALQKVPWITLEPGYGLRDVLFRMSLAHGFQPHIVFELTSAHALLGMVRAGFGSALVPYRWIQLEILHGRLRMAIPDPLPTRDIGVVWRRQRRLSVWARAFRDFLLTVGPSIVEQAEPVPSD